VIDSSESMRAKQAAVNAAAMDLLQASNPADETFVVNFSNEAWLDEDFTSDLGKVRSGLLDARIGGNTALYDAVITAAAKLEQTGTRARKALVVITDGEDDRSRATLKGAIQHVQNLQSPVIYSLGLLYDRQAGDKGGRAQHDLEALSAETGGAASFPESSADIEAAAQAVSRAIRKQYTLGYRLKESTGGGSYHNLKVKAVSPASETLTVRTRRGYIESKD